MRSFFLEGITDQQLAASGLAEAFPEQSDATTKVVFDPTGNDPISWLYVAEPDDPEEQQGPFLVQADVTGRLFDFDVNHRVIEALRLVQARVGGTIRDDAGNTC